MALPCSCLQIQFNGDGPLGGVLAIADVKGQVKGKVGNPAADPPLRPDKKLAVGAAVGRGAQKARGIVALSSWKKQMLC